MPTHAERRVVPYAPEQMYALVADIGRYPDFLPWCLAVREVARPAEDIVTAEMTIGFKALRERFRTRVTLTPSTRIQVEYLDGPFHHLNNHWVFHPHPRGCEIEFYIDFDFRSRLLRLLIGPLFNEAVRIMVRAFEGRARILFRSAPPPSTIPAQV